MSGRWFMVRGGRVWHYTDAVEGPRVYLNRQRGRVALCGVVDDGAGVGRVDAPDCVGCMRRMARD